MGDEAEATWGLAEWEDELESLRHELAALGMDIDSGPTDTWGYEEFEDEVATLRGWLTEMSLGRIMGSLADATPTAIARRLVAEGFAPKVVAERVSVAVMQASERDGVAACLGVTAADIAASILVATGAGDRRWSVPNIELWCRRVAAMPLGAEWSGYQVEMGRKKTFVKTAEGWRTRSASGRLGRVAHADRKIAVLHLTCVRGSRDRLLYADARFDLPAVLV